MKSEGQHMLQNVASEVQNRRVKPEFLDEQMGFPVVLLDSVYEAQSGDTSGKVVPDIAGLEAAMAVARIMDDFKLNGREIKFLRRAIGMKAVDLAEFLDVTAETLSRWENDRELISTNPERVLRMRVYNALRSKAPGVIADADTILGMKFRTLRPAGDGMMMFRRLLAMKDGGAQYVWLYEGTRITSESASAEALRA
jgi:DNA-binding transcriptional regulator YiaG